MGSVLSDLIGEIILAKIDRNISINLKTIDFIAVRFKDDYRILCKSEDDAKKILKTITQELSTYNLSINENKTSILKLPDGLYRKHDREYFPHTLRRENEITFKVFEHTLLIALDIHRKNPGTSILEKFISEIFDRDKKLKIKFSKFKKDKEIKKVISLLFLVKRESEKLLCYVLSVVEELYESYSQDYPDLKEYLKSTVENEIFRASYKGSIFEIVWLVFFSKYIGLGIDENKFKSLVSNDGVQKNKLYKSILNSKQEIFKDSGIKLFKKPKDCREVCIAKYLDVFNRDFENVESDMII